MNLLDMNTADVGLLIVCLLLVGTLWARHELRRRRRARRRLAGRLQVEGPFRPNRRRQSDHIADAMLYARRAAAQRQSIPVFRPGMIYLERQDFDRLRCVNGVVSVPEGVRLVVDHNLGRTEAKGHSVEPASDVDGKRW